MVEKAINGCMVDVDVGDDADADAADAAFCGGGAGFVESDMVQPPCGGGGGDARQWVGSCSSAECMDGGWKCTPMTACGLLCY